MRFSGLVAFLLLSSTTEARFNLRRLDRDRTRGGRGAAPSPGGSSTGGSTRPLPTPDGSRAYRFNTTPSSSENDEDTDAQGDLAPKDGDVDIPDPELAPNIIEFAPGAPGNTGDIQDSPNVDGGGAPPDLPPRQVVPQDLPPLEDGFESFTPPPGDNQDTPGTDGGDGVEIPAMEPIPDPLPGNRDSDLPVDLPSGEDGFLSFAPPPGDNQDSPGNDGGVDVSEMEPEPASAGHGGPVVLPFGAESESYILGRTASVCAPDLAHAEVMCSTLPICKYKNQGTQLVPHQEDCVRRCDAPLNATQCSNHEACHHFVLGC